MRILNGLIFILCLSPLGFGQTNFTIGRDSVGGVQIGMTVQQARIPLKGCRLKRVSDGEGVALIGVHCSRKEVMTLYAGEDLADSPINENARIEMIEVWDGRIKTAQGVHKGMSVSEAERRVGKVERIELTHIESREFVTFSRQRKGISYHIYGGIYRPRQNVTKGYGPGTRIHSIRISRP